MTEVELKHSLAIVSTNYNRPLDENIMTLWKALFINFNVLFFKKACLKVITTNKFFPNASEIIDAYQLVKNESERERYNKLKENQMLITVKQAYCYLCDNSGYCFYAVSGYEYAARCICSHGQDLNKFSQSQINHEHIPETRESYSERDNNTIKHSKNPFYIPTIQEVLKDDFTIFDARKKEKYLSRETIDDKKKAEILISVGGIGA